MDNIEKLKLTIQNIRCYICKNVLSVAPITVLSEDTSKLCCGRCKDIEPESRQKGELYESILSCLMFPCVNKQCISMLAWGHASLHEKVCEYKEILCPVLHGNMEKIRLSSIEQHFFANHKANMQRGCVVQTVNKDHSIPILLLMDNEKFLVYLFNNSRILAMVFAIQPSKKYRKFNVTVIVEKNSNFFVNYTGLDIINFDERKHCFKCFTNRCNFREHGYSNLHPVALLAVPNEKVVVNMGHKNYMNTINERLKFSCNTTNITFFINLVPNDDDDEGPQVKKLKTVGELLLKETFDKNNIQLRENLECPVCKKLITSAMFSCKNGHTACKNCKTDLKSCCPRCHKKLTGIRCIPLQSLCAKLELPCIYEKNGCQYIEKINALSKHEEICPKQN